MKDKLLKLFRKYDLTASIDEWNENDCKIYLQPYNWDNMIECATILLEDIKLNGKVYIIYWDTAGCVSYKDLTNLINDISELNK